MAKYVQNETYIPNNDLERIRTRLISQIRSMDEAELKIIAKSEASLRDYITEAFKSTAQLFGYIVGQVVGTLRDIGSSISQGWNEGWKAGLGG